MHSLMVWPRLPTGLNIMLQWPGKAALQCPSLELPLHTLSFLDKKWLKHSAAERLSRKSTVLLSKALKVRCWRITNT